MQSNSFLLNAFDPEVNAYSSRTALVVCKDCCRFDLVTTPFCFCCPAQLLLRSILMTLGSSDCVSKKNSLGDSMLTSLMSVNGAAEGASCSVQLGMARLTRSSFS